MKDRPLSAVAFEVLLSLADGEGHGYEIMRDIEERTGQTMHPGTLYRAVSRLVDEGLLEELEERPAPELDDERRRYYALTAEGRVKARREAERLEAQVRTARAKKLLGKSRA
jgi:DNA-binding PadR family transcriptional regulator